MRRIKKFIVVLSFIILSILCPIVHIRAEEFTITEANGFSEGLAWVVYEQNGEEYTGCINKAGELQFSFEGWGQGYAYEEGLGYLRINDSVYLLDTKGNILRKEDHFITGAYVVDHKEWSQEDGVIAWGGGCFVLQSFKSGFDQGALFTYSIIDSNGTVLHEFTHASETPMQSICYLGGGVFSYSYSLGVSNFFFTKPKVLSERWMSYDYMNGVHVQDGIFPFFTGSYYDENTGDYHTIMSLGEAETGSYYDIEIPSELGDSAKVVGITERMILLTDQRSCYYVYDMDQENFRRYDGRYADHLRWITSAGADDCYGASHGIFALMLKGMDGKPYVGLIDKDFNEICEPIEGEVFVVEDTLIVISDFFQMKNRTYDLSGNLLFQYEKQRRGDPFPEDAAEGLFVFGSAYYDYNGNMVLSEVHLPEPTGVNDNNMSTKIESLTSDQVGSFTVRWLPVEGVSGYQIRYGTNPDFSDGSYKTASTEYGKNSHSRKDVSAGETYYVCVRTFILEGEEKKYSDWSAAESITVSTEESINSAEKEDNNEIVYHLKTEENYNINDGSLNNIVRYEYNDAGLVQNMTMWSCSDDSAEGRTWTGEKITSYQYNSEGQLNKEISSSTTLGKEITSYQYNDQGLLSKKTVTTPSYTREEEYTYDERGNCIREESGKWTENWSILDRTYDENGRILTEVSDWLSASGESLFSEGYRFVYDEQGRLLRKDDYFGNGGMGVEYIYDDFGNISEETEFYGDHKTTMRYTYDNLGHKLTSEELFYDQSMGLSSYTYDEDGNLLSVTTDGVLVTRYVYEGTRQKDTDSSWKTAMMNEISSIASDQIGIAYMFYLNNDDIPEILYDTTIYASGMYLIWYDGESVHNEIVASGARIFFIPRSGIFLTEGGIQGIYKTDVYELSGGEIKTIAEGQQEIHLSNEADNQYEWNAVAVTKEQYYTELDKLVDPNLRTEIGRYLYSQELAKNAPNPYDFEQIISVLS